MKKLLLFSSTAALLFAACNNSDMTVEGYKPIYLSKDELNNITNAAPIPIENTGKIYYHNDRFFQIEKNKGIHVLDVTDKNNPIYLTFISMKSVDDISIKGNYLYANNFNNLVILNISDIHNVKVEANNKDVFSFIKNDIPPKEGYFECIDESKGDVIGWEITTLNNPKCKL